MEKQWFSLTSLMLFSVCPAQIWCTNFARNSLRLLTSPRSSLIPFLNRFGNAIFWPATYGRPIDGRIAMSRACKKDQLIPGTKISQGLGRYIYLWCMLNDQVKIIDQPWCWLSNWLLLLPRCDLNFFFLGMLLGENRISQRLQIYSKARGEFFTSSSEKMVTVPSTYGE